MPAGRRGAQQLSISRDGRAGDPGGRQGARLEKRRQTAMSKTIILGTLTASAAFALLPLTAATAQPPASVKTALWGRPPGRWCQSPRSREPAERDGHECNDRHDRPGRDARRERRPNRAANAAPGR